MSTTSSGRRAEDLVAAYLKEQKFKVLDQNWRRRSCEIDIVAIRKKVIYFVEVKYRGSSQQGTGLDYITEAKLKQMRFAAEVWTAENKWSGDYCLQAAEVDSNDQINIVDC